MCRKRVEKEGASGGRVDHPNRFNRSQSVAGAAKGW